MTLRIVSHTISRQFAPRAAVCVWLAAALSACTAPKSAATRDDSSNSAATATRNLAVRDSVEALLKEFTTKMNSGDLDGAGNLYSDDSSFYWIEGGSLLYRSAAEVRRSLQSLKNIPEIEMTYYETKVDVLSPTIANVQTEFSQTFRSGTGKGDTYGGYLTMTVVREKAGWRMRSGHTSSRRPRPG